MNRRWSARKARSRLSPCTDGEARSPASSELPLPYCLRLRPGAATRLCYFPCNRSTRGVKVGKTPAARGREAARFTLPSLRSRAPPATRGPIMRQTKRQRQVLTRRAPTACAAKTKASTAVRRFRGRVRDGPYFPRREISYVEVRFDRRPGANTCEVRRLPACGALMPRQDHLGWRVRFWHIASFRCIAPDRQQLGLTRTCHGHGWIDAIDPNRNFRVAGPSGWFNTILCAGSPTPTAARVDA
jgi:hypothetical protein